jgi:hypothetical protein
MATSVAISEAAKTRLNTQTSSSAPVNGDPLYAPGNVPRYSSAPLRAAAGDQVAAPDVQINEARGEHLEHEAGFRPGEVVLAGKVLRLRGVGALHPEGDGQVVDQLQAVHAGYGGFAVETQDNQAY